MRRWAIGVAVGLQVLGAGAAWAANRDLTDLTAEVRQAELSFAKTMADRDLKAFGSFIADEGVFFGAKGAIKGRDAVVEAWRRFFTEKAAPFSWKPETVEVLPSGSLALTSGPVYDSKGTLTNTFTTLWRLEKDGKWRVVFDKGNDVCEPEKKP
jgi:ketosteroid isomerase-like protein